jgi:hypothetical protein
MVHKFEASLRYCDDRIPTTVCICQNSSHFTLKKDEVFDTSHILVNLTFKKRLPSCQCILVMI